MSHCCPQKINNDFNRKENRARGLDALGPMKENEIIKYKWLGLKFSQIKEGGSFYHLLKNGWTKFDERDVSLVNGMTEPSTNKERSYSLDSELINELNHAKELGYSVQLEYMSEDNNRFNSILEMIYKDF